MDGIVGQTHPGIGAVAIAAPAGTRGDVVGGNVANPAASLRWSCCQVATWPPNGDVSCGIGGPLEAEICWGGAAGRCCELGAI